MEEGSLVKSDTYAWNDGRRIVDLLELSKQLQCKHCSSILDLRRTEKEARFGLASVLYVTCQCGAMNDVHTSKKQETTNGSPMYEVNIRASINLLLYGTGASHILSFLSVLDIPIPPLDETSLIIPMTANGDTEGVSGDTGVTSVSSSHASSSPAASAANNSALTFSANPGFPNHSSVHKDTSFPVTSSKSYDSLLTARMDTCSDIDLSQNKSSPSQEREDTRNASPKKQHKQLQRSMRKRSSEAGYSDDDFVNPLEWSSSSDESSSSQDSDSTWKGSDYGLEEEEEQEEEEVEEEEEIEEDDVNEKPQRQKTRSGGSGKRDPAPATSRECPLCGKCLSTVKGYINHLSIIHGQETPDQEAVLKGQKRTRGRKMTGESIGDPDSQPYYEHLLQMLPVPAELDKNETEIQEEVNDYLIMCPICRKFFVMERWNFVSHMRCKHDINDIQADPHTLPLKDVIVKCRREVGDSQHYFRCLKCMRAFTLREQAADHIRIDAKNKASCIKFAPRGRKLNPRQKAFLFATHEYLCHTCGKVFKKRSSFTAHVNSCPMDEKKYRYQCDKCSFATLFKYMLRRHLQTHEPGPRERPHICELCGKSFMDRSYLCNHKKTVHIRDKKFECNVCSRIFYNRCAHKKHVITHLGIRPHKCDMCGQGYTTSYNLTVHKRIHSGERPYQCQQCDATFAQKNSLNVHMKKHQKYLSGSFDQNPLLSNADSSFQYL